MVFPFTCPVLARNSNRDFHEEIHLPIMSRTLALAFFKSSGSVSTSLCRSRQCEDPLKYYHIILLKKCRVMLRTLLNYR